MRRRGRGLRQGLGKPIARLVISHTHPDHYQGAARFGVPVHALPETTTDIVAMGDKTDLPYPGRPASTPCFDAPAACSA